MSRKKTSRRKKKARGTGARAQPERRILAENRRARREYTFIERFEAGIALTGAEVKSCRNGGANLKDSYGKERNGEMLLVKCHIAPYAHAPAGDADPERSRKLLLHAEEMRRIQGKLTLAGLTLIPTRLYVRNGWIKVEMALAKGIGKRDRREIAKKREATREIRSALGRN